MSISSSDRSAGIDADRVTIIVCQYARNREDIRVIYLLMEQCNRNVSFSARICTIPMRRSNRLGCTEAVTI